MRHTRKPGQPQVFLSFAGEDHEVAECLRRNLKKHHNIEVFDFPPGANLVREINRALTQSDYFVLLWSRNSAERPWVEAEWSAAFARELQFVRELRERRSFLFVVRLDATPLPPLLAPRHYLDVAGGCEEMVNELVATWYRDREVDVPVLPAPYPRATGDAVARGQTLVLYVRNRDLRVAHVIVAPAELTGQSIDGLVRSELALPDSKTILDGKLGARFYYQLMYAGKMIPVDGAPLVELGITDGAMIDLEVRMESFGPEGPASTVVYRTGESTGFSAATRSLREVAFGHLIPWR